MFDPFTDRTSRDIRNSLSTAFVAELMRIEGPCLASAAQRWLTELDDPPYTAYIHQRVRQYRHILRQMKSIDSPDLRWLIPLLWNAELFFELHEVLETRWKVARGRERTAVKGLIQAAGVYVHSQRGNLRAAKALAARALKHLRSDAALLRSIGGLERVIRHLEAPDRPPPKLPVPRWPAGAYDNGPGSMQQFGGQGCQQK